MHDPQFDSMPAENLTMTEEQKKLKGLSNSLVVVDEIDEPAFVDVNTTREGGIPIDKDGNVIDMQKVVDAVPLMQRISAAMEELVTSFDNMINSADDFGKAMAIVMVKYELEVKDVSSYTYLDYVEYMASQKYVDKETRDNPFVEFRKGVKQWDDTMKEWSVLAERDARIQKKEALEKQQREWVQNAIDNPDSVKGPMPNRADRRRAAKARKKGNR